MQKVKLIWEYRGPNAKGIAEHQIIHLEEYCLKNNILNNSTGIEKFQENVWFAFLLLDEKNHDIVAKELKPRYFKRVPSL